VRVLGTYEAPTVRPLEGKIMDEYWDSEDQWVDGQTFEPVLPLDLRAAARKWADDIEAEENDCYA